MRRRDIRLTRDPIDADHTVYYYSSCLSRHFAGEEHSRQQMALIEQASKKKAMIEAEQPPANAAE